MEHLAKHLSGMDEKQTIAAVSVALIDLQGRISQVVQAIQSQHPASFISGLMSTADTGSGTGAAGDGLQKAGYGSGTLASNAVAVGTNMNPLVLSAESIGT